MKKIILLISITLFANYSFSQCESLFFMKYSTTYSYSGITFYMRANVSANDRIGVLNWSLKERLMDGTGNKCVHIGEKGRNQLVITCLLKPEFFTTRSAESQKDALFFWATDIAVNYVPKKVTLIGITEDKKHKAEASSE